MTITLASLATQFLERPGLSQNTIDSYESTLMPLLKLYGRWSIEIIDRDILVEYLSNLNDIKFTTHHRHQAVITALFNFAVEQRLLKSNPASQLKRRKPNPSLSEHNSDEEVRYLTSQQLELLHDLRHTWATERTGILQIEELRALMGHEKIQTTLRYSKVTSQRAEEVAQRAFEKIKKYGE